MVNDTYYALVRIQAWLEGWLKAQNIERIESAYR